LWLAARAGGPASEGVVMSELRTCLWFNTEGEEAARFYVDVFPDSSLNGVTPYPEGERAGQVMTVDFVLNGQKFVALNGGPEFTFNEAISFQIPCADQDEVDRYWDTLVAGGEEGPCGWLKDRFGVSWQVVPNRLIELVSSSEPGVPQRVTQALFTMKKILIADLEAAASEKASV
jgi:predicted 3-demethylubiquinone-9 3-methyltransferase (glyoxalase superfamily)